MSAKQFGHFLNLQQQLAALRRPARRAAKTVRAARANAVAEAKDWLAGAGRAR